MIWQSFYSQILTDFFKSYYYNASGLICYIIYLIVYFLIIYVLKVLFFIVKYSNL
ncbi:hypothetical protein K661_03138 [Piscirickettsia salmonis LF-89 = ATCC VR-1361]|nr:hypothetical protein K661_03138 [Piscirickettsia salmonis LF-89 = ATCC VR-1361]